MIGPNYILQGPGMDCMLVAVLNALRYYGFDTPAPGDPEWPGLLWAFGDGDAFMKKPWISSRIKVERGGEGWPRIVIVDNPVVDDTPGGHAIFEPEQGVVVNYHYIRGPVVERVVVAPRTLGRPGGSPWWSLEGKIDVE